ncbi:MAG: carboxypeptidase-like regulatory domain-containing protein [Candidatus Nanosalina sp.]
MRYSTPVKDPNAGNHTFDLSSVNGNNESGYNAWEYVNSSGSNTSDSYVTIQSFGAKYGDNVFKMDFSANGSVSQFAISIETSSGKPVAEGESIKIPNQDFGATLEGNESIGYIAKVPVPSFVDDGEYSLGVESVNGRNLSSDADIEDNVFIGVTQTPVVDDQFTNTSTRYHHAAAFIGSTLKIAQRKSGVFNLLNMEGSIVKPSSGTVNATKNETFDSSGLSEGRYILNGSSGNVTKIDLFDPVNDVVSRIANFTSPEVNVYSYKQADEITSTEEVNITSVSAWKGSEEIFRMNTSVKNYWVEIVGQDHKVVKASRFAQVSEYETCEEDSGDSIDDGGGGGTKTSTSEENDSCSSQSLSEPFVQDFSLGDTYNVSGVVKKGSMNVSGVKVKLKGFKPAYRMKRRYPFKTAPPYFSTFTNSSGMFSFEDVPQGSYKVEIVNDSWVRTDVDKAGGYDSDYETLGDPSWSEDFKVVRGNANLTVKATNETGTLNLSIDGNDGFYYGYELYKFNSDQYFTYSGIGLGNGTNVTLPTGAWDLSTTSYPENNVYDQREKSLGSVNITTGRVVDRKATFKNMVYLNGTVSGATFSGREEAYVSIESRESFNSYFTEVEAGSFSTLVAANTSYRVTIYPPYESSYTSKTKENVSVGGSGKTISFSLSSGKYVTGKVTAGSKEIEEAYVSVNNYSRDVYASDETGENGRFNVTGLKNGSYELSVYPDSPKYDYKTQKVVIGSSEENKSVGYIDVGKALIKLNGTVNVQGSGDASGIELSVETYREDVEDREVTLNASGEYSFNLPSDVFYRITVEPENDDKYKERSKSRYLTENTTINFTLTTPTVFNGTVKTQGGKRIEDAYVYAYNWSKGSYASDTTGPNGTFELRLDKVPHKVEVWPGPESNLPYKKFNISKSEVSDGKNLVYDPSSVTYLSGKVINGNGNGLNGSISIWNESSRSFDYQRLNKTDGSFNLTGLKNVSHNVWISTRNESIPIEETTVSAPGAIGNTKTFALGNASGVSIRKLVVTVRSGRPLANVSVATDTKEKLTNSSGMATFEVATGQVLNLNLNKEGYKSKITDDISTGSSGQTSNIERSYTLNRTQEYSVKINVSEYGSNDTDISPPATVVFVSRDNKSSKGGSATVNNEGDRPSIEHLTTGDYLVGVATGPDTVYENITAKIPSSNPLDWSDTVNLTDSQGNVQFSVWYEVNSQQ